jgi:hypothetical protein
MELTITLRFVTPRRVAGRVYAEGEVGTFAEPVAYRLMVAGVAVVDGFTADSEATQESERA